MNLVIANLYAWVGMYLHTHLDQWNYDFVVGEVVHTSRTVRHNPRYHFEHGIPDNRLKYIQINNMHGLSSNF